MQVGDLEGTKVFELFDAANTDDIAGVFFVDPQGQTGSPETVAGNIPIAGLFKPVAEAAVTHGLGHPPDAIVEFHHAFAQIFDLDVPGIDGAVDQRGFGALTEGIAVHDGALLEQLTLCLAEPTDDVAIGFFAVTAGKIGDQRQEISFGVKSIDEADVGLFTGGKVILTVGGGHVRCPFRFRWRRSPH